MRPESVLLELAALHTRAATEEAARQAAERRQDWQAVREHEQELSRLHARACDLEREGVAA